MDSRDYILKGCRKVYRTLCNPTFVNPECDFDRERSNQKIYELLMRNEPCMISRFGSGEIGVVNNYLTVHGKAGIVKRSMEYITGNTGLPWWDKLFFKSMRNNMGVFPETIDMLNRFSERYLQDIPEIDLLGSFNYTERFMPLRADVINVHLECLYPFFVKNPWTRALKGKKVLIVHPFVESIQTTYQHRTKIFSQPDVWPEYNMKFVRAVQSNAGNEVPFKDWFEALKYMEDEIVKVDFDSCIIGCGAYGLPIAAFVKRLGKQAIHLGGGSQLLFGIKGKRWDNDGYHWSQYPELYTNYSSLYNDYWVRPTKSETPKSAKAVEGACNW